MIVNWNNFQSIGFPMLKRLALGLAAFAVASLAHAAGTIPGFSLTPQFDLAGVVAPGCKLYIIQAGTVAAPQNVYQDTALTLLRPNPMTCDTTGRLPQWFVADGLIKLRLTDKNGVQIFPLNGDSGDNLLVVGPSSGGGGGGGTIDPTTIASTGDVKATYGIGPITGWVRMNGRTIGSATSGATERANADTQALFQYLWGTDANLAVSGGRGASSAADWAANKTIALPDSRNRSLAGLGDMGNSDAGLFSGVTFSSGTGTTLGATLGAATRSLIQSNLPNIAPTIDASTASFESMVYTTTVVNAGASSGFTYVNLIGNGGGAGTHVFSKAGLSGGSITASSINGNVGQTAFTTVSPFLLVTTYLKL
jgi:hypothetical protein